MKPQPLRPKLGPLEVAVYGRWFYMVGSETRPGEVEHFVDLEPELDDDGNPEPGGQAWKCSCEAHFYNVTRPCKHLRVVLRFLAPVFRYFAAFPGATPVSVETTSSHETKRTYQLNPEKHYDATKPNPPSPERRLHPGVHREPAGPSGNGSAGLDRHAPRHR